MPAASPIIAIAINRFLNDSPPPIYCPSEETTKISSNKPKSEATIKMVNGNHVWLLERKLNCAKREFGNESEVTKNRTITPVVVPMIIKPPIRGTFVSRSWCNWLKIIASSPLMALVLACFFQSLCLYKKSIKKGAHKIAMNDAKAEVPRILITLNVS